MAVNNSSSYGNSIQPIALILKHPFPFHENKFGLFISHVFFALLVSIHKAITQSNISTDTITISVNYKL